MNKPKFTIRVIDEPKYRRGTNIWRASQIVTGMEGCALQSIIQSLTAKERETSKVGVGDPPRWLTHFAGLESKRSGKATVPWIEIIYKGRTVDSTTDFRNLLKIENIR